MSQQQLEALDNLIITSILIEVIYRYLLKRYDEFKYQLSL